jgi:hypothetical protein
MGLTEEEIVERYEKVIAHYKEYFLKIATASGADTSGIDRPDQIAFPPIEEYALKEVEELKSCYEEMINHECWDGNNFIDRPFLPRYAK